MQAVAGEGVAYVPLLVSDVRAILLGEGRRMTHSLTLHMFWVNSASD